MYVPMDESISFGFPVRLTPVVVYVIYIPFRMKIDLEFYLATGLSSDWSSSQILNMRKL